MEAAFEKQGSGEPPRVLVVESNRNYLGVLARRLGESGYRIAAAESAQAGFSELYRIPADLILCDARLPGTSGVEFVRMIRHDPVHRHLPVLLTVGRSNPMTAVKAFAAGADGVIRKPCHFEVLAACIARQLRRADSVKRLVQDNAALDARAVSRAIELKEMREQFSVAERERHRLAAIVEGKAA
jgi:DNA-binding response OmpR family regulator